MELRLSNLRASKCVSLVFSVAVSCVAVGESRLAAQDDPQKTLIEIGSDWSYFRGVEEPDENWLLPDFDDGDWEVGPSAFGYGTAAHETQALAGGTRIDDMANSFLSLYIRSIFTVEDVASISAVLLRIRYDDGCVVYLNGEEIARLSMPGTAGDFVAFDTAGMLHEADIVQTVPFTCEQLDLLTDGENSLAIQGHNANLTSSDFILQPELLALTTICPTEMTIEERTNGDVKVRWKRPGNVVYDFLELRRNGELVEKQPRVTSRLYTDKEPLPGKNTYRLKVGVDCEFCEMEISIGGGALFRRGDVDDSGTVNLTDAVVILGALFQGKEQPPCIDAADTNDDGTVNLTDGIYLLGSLFQGTAQPPAPGVATCGADPSDDGLADCVYSAACE